MITNSILMRLNGKMSFGKQYLNAIYLGLSNLSAVLGSTAIQTVWLPIGKEQRMEKKVYIVLNVAQIHTGEKDE